MKLERFRKHWWLFRAQRLLKLQGMDPSFIIIGAQKAGTTALFNYLTEHPLVIPPIIKEVHFFDNWSNFRRGSRWYRRNFAPTFWQKAVEKAAGRPPVTGEATGAYLFLPYVPERAKRILPPEMKFIAVLRDPIERAFSHYNHNRRYPDREPLEFGEAVRREAERIGDVDLRASNPPSCDYFNLKRYSYVSRGLYIDQIERWLRFYPREQFLFLHSRSLLAEPQREMNRVFEFLSLDPFVLQSPRPHHAGDYDRRIDEHTRGFLSEKFREPNNRLFQFLKADWNWESGR